MEITETTLIVKRLCQFFGFAPYNIIRNQSNQIVNFKLSYTMCFYSLALITIFGVSSNIALYYDFHSGHALRYVKHSILALLFCSKIDFGFSHFFRYFRMKTMTLRFIFWVDVNTVSVSSVINIIVSMFALKNTRHVNSLLRKVKAYHHSFTIPSSNYKFELICIDTIFTRDFFLDWQQFELFRFEKLLAQWKGKT